VIDALPPFLLGFLASSFQILLLREFSAYFYGNEITLGILLASWLLFGGIGSATSSRINLRREYFPYLYLIVLVLLAVSLFGIRFSRFLFSLQPGETTGLTPVLITAFGTCLAVSFPLGILFAFNVELASGRVDKIYMIESLGAAAGGLVVYGLLLPFLTQWQIASLLGCLSFLVISISFGRPQFRGWWLLIGLALVMPALLDLPSQRIHWKPFRLMASRDSKYGKIQILKTAEQISVYSNGSLIYAYPDQAAAEEAVHFAMLQNPEAERVLLIGGGAGGSLREILKYPKAKLDYVELDPAIISLSKGYLEPKAGKIFDRENVHLHLGDGRVFVDRSPRAFYDIIILNLPDPSTAQLNRFFTREFFFLVEKKLVPGGVFSFSVSSAENYIGPELRQFLASLYHTLTDIFPVVEIVPGERNIFLASSHNLILEAEALASRVETVGLANVYVSRGYLVSRLHPLRREKLRSEILSEPRKINRDLVPVSFFFHAVLWSSQFKGMEKTILLRIAKVHPFGLIAAPLFLFCLIGFHFRRQKTREAFFLIPLVVMGLTTIVIEILLLLWYQVRYGYLYGRIALLIASFMFGLFFGALIGSRRKTYTIGRLAVAQGLFVFFSLAVLLILPLTPPEFLPFALLFVMGGLSGELFIVSNALYLKEKINYGLGYGLDLAGSFLGALVTSSLLIPLAGLVSVLLFVLLLNILCFLFLMARPRTI